MHELSVRTHQQRITMCIKYVLIMVDLIINGMYEYARKNIIGLILMFIVQDLCLIFSITLIVFSFLSAFIFQADSMGLLYRRFNTPILLCIFYLVSTVALQALILTTRWTTPLKFYWSNGLIAINIAQKLLAVIHYYFYKRTMLKFSDPRFYQT
ncbi:hypothetical protein R5R35_010721 [Gryllus longicercus]|uniref:Transmembrane protein 138 n=1 Tax=Gryllus longicercus TaxID=2509291 RepID=A0AAN9V7P1_9ORTH